MHTRTHVTASMYIVIHSLTRTTPYAETRNGRCCAVLCSAWLYYKMVNMHLSVIVRRWILYMLWKGGRGSQREGREGKAKGKGYCCQLGMVCMGGGVCTQ